MLLYLRTWLIIKRKQFLNLFPAKSNSFVKFAVVCSPRSGSTWLHTLLNSHPCIYSYGEILREEHERNPTKPIPSVQKLVFNPHHPSIKAVGLKLFYEYQNDKKFLQSFEEIASDTSIRIIHLIREDTDAQFESLKRAQSTQTWSSGKKTQEKVSIYTDPAELQNYKKVLAQQKKEMEMRFNGHVILPVRYEDLLEDTEKTCKAIQQFLGVSPRTLFSLLQRQSL